MMEYEKKYQEEFLALKKEFEEFILTIPERCVKNYHVLNCTGNIISYRTDDEHNTTGESCFDVSVFCVNHVSTL